MARLSDVAVGFGQALRANGLDAPISSVTCFAQALAAIGIERPERVFWAGHASFVRCPEETQSYAVVFARYFKEGWFRGDSEGNAMTITHFVDNGWSAREELERGREAKAIRVVRYSASEVLRSKDFATCSKEEIKELRRLMASMRHRLPRRLTRRRVPTRRSRGSPDLRRTIQRALRNGCEPVRLSRQGKGERDRPFVLLIDVSGSMEPYARAFLYFAHAAVAQGRRVETFTFGTRLTRITRQLSWRDPDAAVARATSSVSDISGGTRLGEGLQNFNDHFGVAGVARGAVVVILSDGWDRGEPEKVAIEMARLRRVANRVIWVNPLKATPDYQPLARGMAAALPYLDMFLEGHSLGSLEGLVEAMAGAYRGMPGAGQ